MTASPKRLWFRFSLRTLFIFVTIFGVWLGWNLKFVRERKAVLSSLKQYHGNEPVIYWGLESGEAREQNGDHVYADLREYAPVRISLVRRLMGDETCAVLWMPKFVEPSLIEKAEQYFPEAGLRIYFLKIDPRYNYLSQETVAFRDSLHKPAKDRLPNVGTTFKTGRIEK